MVKGWPALLQVEVVELFRGSWFRPDLQEEKLRTCASWQKQDNAGLLLGPAQQESG